MRCPDCGVQPFAGGPCACADVNLALRVAVVRRVEAALERMPQAPQADAARAWAERTRRELAHVVRRAS